MAITAADVKKLRDLTAAGMLDAKNALEEANGDFDAAVEILRVKGQAKAQKRAGERETSVGLVATAGNALVELKCETDFVAKNDDFIAAAEAIAAVADQVKASDHDALAAAEIDGQTVADKVANMAATLGEKIELGRAAYFEGPVAVYLHRRAADLPPAVGVMVAYEGDEQAARGAAMQIAAMRAQFVSRDEVPADVVDAEREVLRKKTLEEGKPEAAVEKIVEGRLRGFFKEIVLLEQDSVTDSKQSVEQVLQAAGTTIKGFARFEVGA